MSNEKLITENQKLRDIIKEYNKVFDRKRFLYDNLLKENKELKQKNKLISNIINNLFLLIKVENTTKKKLILLYEEWRKLNGLK